MRKIKKNLPSHQHRRITIRLCLALRGEWGMGMYDNRQRKREFTMVEKTPAAPDKISESKGNGKQLPH